MEEISVLSQPKYLWEWNIFGTELGLCFSFAQEISWWQRYWTKVLFGSTWRSLK